MQVLLKGSTSIGSPEEHLNELYTTVLQKAVRPGLSEQEQQMIYDMYRRILGSIVVLSFPLAASSLGKLIGIAEQKIYQALKNLHTILDISKKRAIRFVCTILRSAIFYSTTRDAEIQVWL